MKRKSKKMAPPPTLEGMVNDFVRGFVSCGAIVAMEHKSHKQKFVIDADVLRYATLGGVALVAGVAAGNAAQRRDYATMIVAAAGGLAGVYALDQVMCRKMKRKE